MIVRLLLKRKDESVIRQTCSVMKEFFGRTSESDMKNLVKIHQKEIQYIITKMSKVATYYTQMKLVEILHIILSVTDDGGERIIKQDRHVAGCSRMMVSDTASFFQDIDLRDFQNVGLAQV
jgi:hypothetical protein